MKDHTHPPTRGVTRRAALKGLGAAALVGAVGPIQVAAAQEPKAVDAIVIGAGASGLMAARALGPKAETPIAYVENNWPREQWSKGGYACIPGPGVLTHFGEALRRPVGRIHWAGTETAEHWCGYVDGALRSGERAAKEVLQPVSATG